MSGEESPRDAGVEELHSKLSEGLKTCRTMVSRYRALLGADPQDAPANDEQQSVPSGSEDSNPA